MTHKVGGTKQSTDLQQDKFKSFTLQKETYAWYMSVFVQCQMCNFKAGNNIR
jgi:hypothetical protein